jgi:hypothetical protein
MVVNINDTEKIIKLTNHLNELKTYYRVTYAFTSFKDMLDDKDERTAWCEEHCKDKFYTYFNTWYFENEQDYLMFMLRWSK